MKTLAALAAAATLLIPAGGKLEPGPWTIKITGTLVSTMRLSPNRQARTYALYNRPTYQSRIGLGFVICYEISNGYTDCQETLRLTRGIIVARGVSPSASALRTLAVVGGTGLYANVGGQMIVQPLDSSQLILIDLQAF